MKDVKNKLQLQKKKKKNCDRKYLRNLVFRLNLIEEIKKRYQMFSCKERKKNGEETDH